MFIFFCAELKTEQGTTQIGRLVTFGSYNDKLVTNGSDDTLVTITCARRWSVVPDFVLMPHM
jgi:hypothetical protein